MYDLLFRHALFPAYETLVKRRRTSTHARQYGSSQWASPEEIKRLQLAKLNALLAHCWQHVSFLREHWSDAGCRPGTLRDLEDFSRFPLLTKQHITAHYQEMIATNWRGRTLSKVTGGSTGDPFRFEYTMDAYARRTAVMWRGYGWGGAGLGTRTAYLWGTGLRSGGWGGVKDRLYHGAFNRRFFDAFALSEDGIDLRIDEIMRYRPRAVVGYVAPLVLVARRMLQTDRRLTGVRGVLTGAEALFEPERRDIEAAFGCEVFETYGSREVMLMASECGHHDGLHVNADHLLLETVGTDGAPVRNGTSGDVAVTDFHNLGMPMVRYLNGDRATYSGKTCGCGRGLPLLSSVDGRLLDMIRTPDGRHIAGEFFVAATLDWPQIRQWQVVQTATDCVEVRLVVPDDWGPPQRDRLAGKISSVVGPSMRVIVTEVAAIAATPSGKRRLTIALPEG